MARRSKSDGTESSPQKPTGLFFFLKQIPRYLNLKKICILFEFFKKQNGRFTENVTMNDHVTLPSPSGVPCDELWPVDWNSAGIVRVPPDDRMPVLSPMISGALFDAC